MELIEQVITETAVKPVRPDLERKIRDRSARLGVIGLGYVGLALAVAMTHEGFSGDWHDIDGGKVDSVGACRSHLDASKHGKTKNSTATKTIT